jgi:hypothetical protein
LKLLEQAIDQVLSEISSVSFQDVARRFLGQLPPSSSDFERGIAIGVALARFTPQPDEP